MSQCPKCNTIVGDSAKFCMECGTPLPKVNKGSDIVPKKTDAPEKPKVQVNAKDLYSDLHEKIRAIVRRRNLNKDEVKGIFELKPDAKRSSKAFCSFVPVRKGTITCISGPNGSGKTKFIQSFLQDLKGEYMKIVLSTEKSNEWAPYADSMYDVSASRMDVFQFLTAMDKLVNEIENTNNQNIVIIIDSATSIVENFCTELESSSVPKMSAGFKPDTFDPIGAILSLRGRYANGKNVTIITTTVTNDNEYRQKVLTGGIIHFSDAVITFCKPQKSFQEIGELSVDYKNGNYTYYGDYESELYYRVKGRDRYIRSNDELNRLVNKTDTYIP